MPSGAGIAFILLSLLFAWLVWRGRESDWGGDVEPLFRLRLRSLIPPLLLVACLPSGCASERFDSLRLFATGMAVTEVELQGGRRAAAPVPGCEAYFRSGENPVFVVGRARGCVDLVVPEPNGATVDGAVVRLDHVPGSDPTIRLASVAGGGGALVAAVDGAGGRTYAGAVDIEEGDRLCIGRCAAPDARWWVFHTDGRLEPAGGGAARQMRLREGPYGWIRPYGPGDRIHRLSGLLCSDPGPDGTCENPALADPPRSGAQAQPALSFLFQEGGVGGSGWKAMLLDPGAQLRRADGAVVRPNLAQAIPLPEDESLHVAVLGMRAGALREIRSFTLSHSLVADPTTQRSFRLALDTPEMIPIGNCAQPLSRLAVTADQLSPEAFSIAAFGNRPGSVLSSAAAGLPIERFDLCRSTRFAFAAPLDLPAGNAGAGPVRKQVEFSVDRMGIPWLLVLLAFAVALMVHAASERLWQRNKLDGQILAVAQYLLVLRAIIGIEGVFNDPALDWRLIYSDVGTALIALPAILVAVRRREDIGFAAVASLGLFVLMALAALWWWLGRPDLIGQFLAALALGALAVRAVTLSRRSPLWGGQSGTDVPPTSAIVSGGQGEPDHGGRAAASAAEKIPAASPVSDDESLPAADAAGPHPGPPHGREGGFSFSRLVLDQPPGFWKILLGAIVAARIVLGLLGYRERIFGVALSAIYVPLLLVSVAAVLAQAEAGDGARRRWLGLMFLGALALGAGVVALVINDIGFALVHVPPIAGVALWRLGQWRKAQPADGEPGMTRTTRLIWAAPAAGLVAGYFALWALVAFTPPPGDEAPLEDRVAYAVEQRSTNPNWLRLRAVFAPDQIPRIGNRAAAVQLDQSLLLGELTGTILGRGWLTPVDLGTFRWQATRLSDYLSASHIMAPFGRAGAIALLLVLAAVAAAAVTRRVSAPWPWPNLAGALAIWTLFGAAAYMVLANLLLVPFTGRNIYLLAASSGGDLMEGLGLLLMARIGLAYRRNA